MSVQGFVFMKLAVIRKKSDKKLKKKFKTKKVNFTIEFCIFEIRISLGTKFQLKLTIFISWTKFA